ncbi:MAG: hypothetical protein ACKO7B_16630, partial [Flavobacteriales bacterium]
MKKGFLLLLLALAIGRVSAQDIRLNAYFSYAAFDVPGGKPYLETYLQVGGPSVTFQTLPDGKYQGTIEVRWIFRKGESIVAFDKYLLRSPLLDS